MFFFYVAKCAHPLPPYSDELPLPYFAVSWKPDPDIFFSAETLVQEWTGFPLSIGRAMEPGMSRKATLSFYAP